MAVSRRNSSPLAIADLALRVRIPDFSAPSLSGTPRRAAGGGSIRRPTQCRASTGPAAGGEHRAGGCLQEIRGVRRTWRCKILSQKCKSGTIGAFHCIKLKGNRGSTARAHRAGRFRPRPQPELPTRRPTPRPSRRPPGGHPETGEKGGAEDPLSGAAAGGGACAAPRPRRSPRSPPVGPPRHPGPCCGARASSPRLSRRAYRAAAGSCGSRHPPPLRTGTRLLTCPSRTTDPGRFVGSPHRRSPKPNPESGRSGGLS